MRLGGACMCDIDTTQVHTRPHILRYQPRFIMTYKYKKKFIPNQQCYDSDSLWTQVLFRTRFCGPRVLKKC